MTLKKVKRLFFLFGLSLILSLNASAQEKTESMDKMWGSTEVSVDALKNGKGKLFDEGNFGMFIHWGLYSKLAGQWKDKTYYGIGEWIMNPRVADIPLKDYMQIANEFNPVNFDAKKIAKLAKDAGMKYIIITSKHHDGFAMFDSKASDFNIVDATPFGRDPMHELSDACHELGLGFGFYYSHNQDWTAPGGSGGPKVDAKGREASFKEYFYSKCKPQVKEICTNYGQIDFVWFDTPRNMKKEYVVELANMVRELQPKAMMCSRIGHGLGDYSSNGDMEVPTKNIEGLWETCDTNNDSWSYAWYDNNFKNPKEILNRLVSTVARGGSYLFNVGPTGTGEIPEIGTQFLEEAGNWIKRYPQVIYGAGPSPWGHALPWGDVTTQGNSLFLSVFDWPTDDKLYLPGLKSEIESAAILTKDSKHTINFSIESNWVVFNLPFKKPTQPATVIEVKMKNKASETIVEKEIGIYPNINSTLLAELGEVINAEHEKIRWMEKFGEWKHAHQVSNWKEDSAVEWQVNVNETGYYYVDLCYRGDNRLVWKISTDEGVTVQNQQAATEKYVNYNMGILEFKKPGKHTISVSLVDGDTKTSSLKSMLLKPAK